MQIKRRSFSYPILNKRDFLSTYVNKSIELKFEPEENNKFYVLKNLHFECNSSYLLKKIQNNEVSVKCIIECPYTVYKKSYVITEKGKDVLILKNDLAGKVEISLIAFATKDFIMNSSDEFDEDYRDINFNVSNAQILGFDDGFTIFIYHHESSDNLAHSIFSIIRNETSESPLYEISIKTNKIEISLARPLYDKYLRVYNIDAFAEEFFCSLLIPALSEGLHDCLDVARNAEDIEKISEKYNWFNSVLDAFKELRGVDLTLDDFKEMKLNAFAQELLGNPISKALDEINVKAGVDDDETD